MNRTSVCVFKLWMVELIATKKASTFVTKKNVYLVFDKSNLFSHILSI